MLVEASENINHYSVELLTLIIIACAVLWVRAHKGKRRLIITCPKSKIGGSGTPSILLSRKKHGYLEQPEDAEITELIRQWPRVLK